MEIFKILREYKGKEKELLGLIPTFTTEFDQIRGYQFVFPTQKTSILEMILKLEITPTIAPKLIITILRFCTFDEIIKFLCSATKGLQMCSVHAMMKLRKKELLDFILVKNPFYLDQVELVKIFHACSSATVLENFPAYEDKSISWARIAEHHFDVYLAYLKNCLSKGTVLDRYFIWEKTFRRCQYQMDVPTQKMTKNARMKLVELFVEYPSLQLKKDVLLTFQMEQKCFQLCHVEQVLKITSLIDPKDIILLLKSPSLSTPGLFTDFTIALFANLANRNLNQKDSNMVYDYIVKKSTATLFSEQEFGYHTGYEQFDLMKFWATILQTSTVTQWTKHLGMQSKLVDEYSSVIQNDVCVWNQLIELPIALELKSKWNTGVGKYISKDVLKFYQSIESSLYEKLEETIIMEKMAGKDISMKMTRWGKAFVAMYQMLHLLLERFINLLSISRLEFHVDIHQNIQTIAKMQLTSLKKLQEKIGSFAHTQNYSIMDSVAISGPLENLVAEVKDLFNNETYMNWSAVWQHLIFNYLEKSLCRNSVPTSYESQFYQHFISIGLDNYYSFLSISDCKYAKEWVKRLVAFVELIQKRLVSIPLDHRYLPAATKRLIEVCRRSFSLFGRFANVGLPVVDFFHLIFKLCCIENNWEDDWSQFSALSFKLFFTQLLGYSGSLTLLYPLELETTFEKSFLDRLVDVLLHCLSISELRDVSVVYASQFLYELNSHSGWNTLLRPLVTLVVEKTSLLPTFDTILQMYNLDSWEKEMGGNLHLDNVFDSFCTDYRHWISRYADIFKENNFFYKICQKKCSCTKD
jgi:hypothetical protein